jgi:transcriptional regulator with XRE-family HTH domain
VIEMTMYDRIKFLRLKKGLSQKQLAALAGYNDRSSIAKIEAGAVDLPQSKIITFSHVLGVSPAELMGLTERAQPSTENAIELTVHEKNVIVSYRSHPEMQPAVDRLLGVEESFAQEKQA